MASKPRLSQGVSRKIEALESLIEAAHETGVLDPDELVRLATDVKREAQEPHFLQAAKRAKGVVPASIPVVPAPF